MRKCVPKNTFSPFQSIVSLGDVYVYFILKKTVIIFVCQKLLIQKIGFECYFTPFVFVFFCIRIKYKRDESQPDVRVIFHLT